LRATLDWSYALLSEAERKVLRRLAIFAGGWMLAAAEAVCAGEGIDTTEVLDLLAGLMGKSLVVLEEGEDPSDREGRYRLLETVRQYALEHLVASSEAAAVQERHLDWCLSLAELAAPALEGREPMGWLERLSVELDNLRAALRWAQDTGQVARGLRLAGAMGLFWQWHGHHSEGRRWLEGFLAQSPEAWWVRGEDDAAEGNLRARALLLAAHLAFMQTDTGAAAELADQCLALCTELGDPTYLARALWTKGIVARDQGDFGRAIALLEESLAIRRGLGNKRGIAGALFNLALTVLQQGQTERAATLAQEDLALIREVGGAWDSTEVPLLQGMVAWEQGDLVRAHSELTQSLAGFRELGDKRASAAVLYLLSLVVRERGDLRRAVALSEESLILARDLGAGGMIGWALLALGLAACEQGELECARTALAESVALLSAAGMKWYLARSLAGLAGVAYGEGQAQRAARLAGATEALLTSMDAPLPRGERAGYGRTVAAARAALGDSGFTAAWETGQALPLADVVAEALESAHG
jgi:tetratricopeptide (TPR) repeat protein